MSGENGKPLAELKTPRDTAIALLGRGLWPVVIYPRGAKVPGREKPAEGKEPIGKAWGAVRLSLDDLRERFGKNRRAGVGLCLGPSRGPGGSWLIDIEGDGPEADESRVRLFGGEDLATVGWGSTRGAHHLLAIDPDRLGPLLARLAGYECKGPMGVGVYKLPELPGLEFRIGGFKSDGRTVKQIQSVVPPTPGTNGKPRTWNGVEAIAEAPESFYEALGRLGAGPARRPDPEPHPSRIGAGHEWTAEERARAYLAKCDPAIAGSRGHDTTFRVACKLVEFGISQEAALRILLDDYNPRCEPQWSETELRHKVEDAFRENASRKGDKLREGQNGDGNRNSQHHAGSEDPGASGKAEASSRFNMTDLGNAERLVSRHGESLRHNHLWRKWLHWDGRRWALDQTAAVGRLAAETVRSIYREASAEKDEDDRKRLVRWALDSESHGRISSMIRLAAPMVPILIEDMDRNPWFLNCLNGTVDLRTGERHNHRRDDGLTKLAPINFDPKASCPTWDATLGRIFAENAELIRFWQQLCGLALSGDVSEQILPILYGTGANGKSTVLNALMGILGTDYAMKAPHNFLMIRRNEAHPTELADLFGKRLVVAVETAEGAQINETLIKELTGSDKIRARRMREDHWEFNPTHKVFLCTNHRPMVKGTDHAIWRRLKLTPFGVTIPEEQQDRKLSRKLIAEAPGILAWAIRGCLDWRSNGLRFPEEVAKATKAYREDQDILGSFLSEHCVESPGNADVKAKAGDLYSRYRKWAEGSGESAATQRRFGEALAERGFVRFTNNGTWYRGIGLRPTDGSY